MVIHIYTRIDISVVTLTICQGLSAACVQHMQNCTRPSCSVDLNIERYAWMLHRRLRNSTGFNVYLLIVFQWFAHPPIPILSSTRLEYPQPLSWSPGYHHTKALGPASRHRSKKAFSPPQGPTPSSHPKVSPQGPTNEWMNEWMNEWVSDWVSEWMNECMSEWMNEWMDGWMNEWMTGWIHKWVDEWMDAWMNEWICGRRNEWMNAWTN